ncbi:TPA: restriction endonuclease subunit S [Neisseria subflava]|uniref:restriction endonuclease subunit S n=1 Tax=Neisseria subflava TaxID=28449 RepID=UPI00131CC137|nr:restriction endonuclease subunit S [Neisseria subflava]
MNKQQEPRLRFKGFTGTWEEKKVIDFSPLQRGFDLPVSKITEGDYPVVFSNGILKSHNQYKVKGVGIVTGRSGTIGEVTFVEKDFWPHNTALWVTNFFGNNPQFVFHFLKNFDLSRFATGSGVPTLNRNDVHNQTIYVPKFEEQTYLGNFFRRLDSQIAESRAVLEKSRQLKKAMLAKMFPANGEKIPKIRFKGFKGDWESRKLGELCTITTGKLDANAMTENGRYDFFTSGIKKYKIDHYAFIGPAITIAGNGATIGYMHYADGYFNAYQRTYVLTGIQANRNFIFSEINQKLQNKIKQESRAGNIPYIVLDMLTELSIDIPTIEEQTAIGNFFRQLDETIALQTAEVEKLNQLKKGLLAAMLV